MVNIYRSSFKIRLIIPGSALPFISFMVWPTKNPRASWLRKVLGEFLLRDSERRGVTGEHDGAHARGAAVEGENGRVGVLHGDAQETRTFESSSILLSLTRFGSCKIIPTQSSSRPGTRATPFGRGYAAVRRAPWRCVPCGRTIAHERVDEIDEHRAARKRRRKLRDSR